MESLQYVWLIGKMLRQFISLRNSLVKINQPSYLIGGSEKHSLALIRSDQQTGSMSSPNFIQKSQKVQRMYRYFSDEPKKLNETDIIKGRTVETLRDHGGEFLAKKVVSRLVKRLNRRLGSVILLKIGRGVGIGIPIIGGMLGLLAIRNDFKRYLFEKKLNRPNASSFLIAASLNLVDVVCHINITLGKRNNFAQPRLTVLEAVSGFFGLGLDLESNFVLWQELFSIGASILATGFAIRGEIVSIRLEEEEIRRKERN